MTDAKCDSQKPLSHARILTLDGQEIATGLLGFGTREGIFQATEPLTGVNIDSVSEVLAEVDSRSLHLVNWHRCKSWKAEHFHFQVAD